MSYIQGRRRQVLSFFFLNQSIKFLSGKVDVEYEINLSDDTSHSKISKFYQWKGPTVIANEDKCNNSGLEKGQKSLRSQKTEPRKNSWLSIIGTLLNASISFTLA